MSDRNTIYPGVIEFQDADIIIAVLPPKIPFGPKQYINLPGPIRELMNKNNALSTSTVQAVKVAYSGGNRNAWLSERINAIDERVKFIKTRTDALLSNLQDKSDPAYNALLSGFSLAVSAVPVVGSLIAGIVAKDQAAQKQAVAIDQLKTQMLIRDYTDDLKELSIIRSTLAKEYVGQPVIPKIEGDGLEKIGNAPTPIPVWYYYVGVFVLLMVILVILRNRNQSNR